MGSDATRANGRRAGSCASGEARSATAFTEQQGKKIVQNDIPINQPSEIRNETTKKVYLVLDGCMLLDEKVGDYTIHFKKGTDPDLKKILDK